MPDLTRAEIMAATPEQLDEWAAVLVGHKGRSWTKMGDLTGGYVHCLFSPSTDHSDAAKLLERVPEDRFSVSIKRGKGGTPNMGWHVGFTQHHEGNVQTRTKMTTDRTMPLAITRAVLILHAEGHLETKT